MAKTHVYYFSDHAPNTARDGGAISITAGKRKCVALPAPIEGRVTRLTVKQASGTPKAYTVELMESIIPYPLGEAAYNAALVTGINPELYRVIPQQAGNVSAAVEFKQDQGQAYRNAESTPSTGADGRVLYLVIIPTLSVDTTTWEVSFTSVSDIG